MLFCGVMETSAKQYELRAMHHVTFGLPMVCRQSLAEFGLCARIAYLYVLLLSVFNSFLCSMSFSE
jgi:hypothetical protein